MRCIITITFILVLNVSNIEPKWFQTFAGPFKVVVKKFELCPESMYRPKSHTWNIEVKIIRGYHQLERYLINASVPFAVNDNLTFKAAFASWSNNGGWKNNAQVLNIKRTCSEAFRLFRPFIRFMLIQWTGEMLSCPFLPGLYRFVNATFPEHLLYSPLIQNFVYGRWRIDAQLFDKDNEVVACLRIFADTQPK